MPMIAAKASWLPRPAREGKEDLLTITYSSSQADIEVVRSMDAEPKHQNADGDSKHD